MQTLVRRAASDCFPPNVQNGHVCFGQGAAVRRHLHKDPLGPIVATVNFSLNGGFVCLTDICIYLKGSAKVTEKYMHVEDAKKLIDRAVCWGAFAGGIIGGGVVAALL